MNEATMQYGPGSGDRGRGISGHESGQGAHGHQGEPIVRQGKGRGGGERGEESEWRRVSERRLLRRTVRAGWRVLSGDGAMGEAQTMREKGGVWKLRVI